MRPLRGTRRRTKVSFGQDGHRLFLPVQSNRLCGHTLTCDRQHVQLNEEVTSVKERRRPRMVPKYRFSIRPAVDGIGR